MRHWGAGSGQESPSWRTGRRPPPRPLTGAAPPPPPAGCSGCWRTGGGGAGSVRILTAPHAAPEPSGRSLKGDNITGAAQSWTISLVWQSCRQVKYGETWRKSLTSSTGGPETDIYRPGIVQYPAGGEHSSKELFKHLRQFFYKNFAHHQKTFKITWRRDLTEIIDTLY